jgi:hypothetical protein
LDITSGGQVYYNSWFDFKRDIESRLGRGLPVSLWMRAKPNKPLPWRQADLQATLSEVRILQKGLDKSGEARSPYMP